MKNILLLGSTGKTGTEVLNLALAKGYHVKALVRDKGNVRVKSGNLTLIIGTPVNINDVRAIGSFEAVISTLGHPFNPDPNVSADRNSPTMMADSIKNVITVMKEKGIRRIILQTGAGAGDSYNRMPVTLQRMITDSGLKNAYLDHDAQEKLVMNSGLEWTIVRPVGMTDNEGGAISILKGQVRRSHSIGRKNVAKFLLGCLETEEFIGKAVIIAETSSRPNISY